MSHELQNIENLKSLFIDTLKLNERYYTDFLHSTKTISLKRKTYLIKEGQTCKFIGFLQEGVMRSFIQNDGKEFNNDFYFANDFVSAYTSFLTFRPTNCNIQALTDSKILILDRDKFNEMLKNDNSWLKFGKHISDNYFIKKCKRETSFLKNTAGERFEQLLDLYPNIEQKISQYHIASYLGISPETLSRLKLLTYINKNRNSTV